MPYIKIGVTLLVMLNYGIASTQNFDRYRWENRLVLILVDDTDNKIYSNQIEEFNNHLQGIKDRKIEVYQISPEKFKRGLSDEKWQVAKTNYGIYKKTDGQIEIVLLGLDGGVKIRATEFLSCKKLFTAIDAMPMRIQEMKRSKNSK